MPQQDAKVELFAWLFVWNADAQARVRAVDRRHRDPGVERGCAGARLVRRAEMQLGAVSKGVSSSHGSYSQHECSARAGSSGLRARLGGGLARVFRAFRVVGSSLLAG